MAEVCTVLLVPEKGDPHGVLRRGPCDAQPPTAVKVEEWIGFVTRRVVNTAWVPCGGSYTKIDQDNVTTEAYRGLVLAWEREPLEVAFPYVGTDSKWLWKVVMALLGKMEGPACGIQVFLDAVEDLPGTIVLLDADGQEVERG